MLLIRLYYITLIHLAYRLQYVQYFNRTDVILRLTGLYFILLKCLHQELHSLLLYEYIIGLLVLHLQHLQQLQGLEADGFSQTHIHHALNLRPPFLLALTRFQDPQFLIMEQAYAVLQCWCERRKLIHLTSIDCHQGEPFLEHRNWVPVLRHYGHLRD